MKLFHAQHIKIKNALFRNNHRLENNPKKLVQDRALSFSPEETGRAA